MISILIAIARHSPTCANAIIKCERLVQTVVGRFAEKDKMGVYPSKIKSVTLLKVCIFFDMFPVVVMSACFKFLQGSKLFWPQIQHKYILTFCLM